MASSCVLRATGNDFQVSEYLRNSSFEPVNVFTVGERKSASSVWDTSGVTVSVGDGKTFPEQVAEAIAFIRNNSSELLSLKAFAGVEVFELDFGIFGKEGYWQSYIFPLELIHLASDVSLELELSIYATQED